MHILSMPFLTQPRFFLHFAHKPKSVLQNSEALHAIFCRPLFPAFIS